MKTDYTILIVDDTPENLSILGEFLSEYNIKVALNGVKAISIAFTEPFPDLILLDIMMPDMDGYHVCRQLKENPKTKNIPVIFISAMTDVDDKVKGFNYGAVDYITKPFQIEEVRSRINTHLTLSSLQKRLANINIELEQKVNERTIELIAAKNKAEESNKVKGYFLALMSHELRTPMTGILGFAETLRQELTDEMQKEMSRMIFESGLRLKNTLDSILSFSRVESGKIKPEPIAFDIVEKSVILMHMHELHAQSKGLQLKFIPEDKVRIIALDEAMYEIIFNNLVNNALKYTNHGSITVDLFMQTTGDFNFLCLKVSDTGIGIPQDKLDIIFEEFRQADEGMSRNFEGVGLGLSLVKRYSEAMGGDVEVISRLGSGSTFIVRFPIKQTESAFKNTAEILQESVAAIKRMPKPRDGKRPRVLLVEDDKTNIIITRIFLSDYADLAVCENGEDALKLVQREQFSAVLLDINLGRGLSGIEVAGEIRKLNGYQSVPVIAFTAFALEGDKEMFMSAGCSHYLAKPCNKNELINLLDEVISE